jgi:dihydrofolate reductase
MISIIVAIAKNGVIGGTNALLWHISEDLQRFKRLTTGHPVVMGRKTFDSIGKPLPNRTNVIITRQQDYRAEGCKVAHSLDEAIKMFSPEEEVFIIGGGEIYNQAWDLADRLYITWVEAKYNGDTFFPDNYLKYLRKVNEEDNKRTKVLESEDRLVGTWYNPKESIFDKWKITHREHHQSGVKFNFPFTFVDYQRVSRDMFPQLFDVEVTVKITHS